MYQVILSKKARKDRTELERSGSGDKVEKMLKDISEDPFSLSSKKLNGEAFGLYSRRLNITDRMVFEAKDSTNPRYIFRRAINTFKVQPFCAEELSVIADVPTL